MTDEDWPAQEPPPKFAEHVVAAAMREHGVSARRRYIAAAAAVAIVAAAGVALFVATRSSEVAVGDARAEQRLEVAIGSRAVAVLEPGAHIAWTGDTVVQDTGDVFYRVEPGSRFEVHTPMANAAVLGTCFRISVNDKETMMRRRDFGAGALGAIAATAVVIGVYEGKVQVSHGKDTVTVGAGETAVADPRGVRPGAPAKVVARTDDPTRGTADLKERLAAVEQEKAQLEQELATAHEAGAKNPYDLTPDDWAKLAEQGAFKYQLPCFREGGYRPTPEQLDKLALTAKDADAIQAAYRHANEQFGTAMKEICAQRTGAANDDDIPSCISKMFTNLYAQGSDNARATYTQIAEIRAGKRPEPRPDQMTPTLKMLLQFSTGMKGFEAELAQTFGADEAHRIAFSDDLCFSANSFR